MLQVDIKENKYRTTFTVIGIEGGNTFFDSMLFECINLSGVKEEKIVEYNKALDESVKGILGERKRKELLSSTKPMIEEVNKNLLTEVKMTFNSIQKVNSKDDW
jgi:hypothetical protein